MLSELVILMYEEYYSRSAGTLREVMRQRITLWHAIKCVKLNIGRVMPSCSHLWYMLNENDIDICDISEPCLHPESFNVLDHKYISTGVSDKVLHSLYHNPTCHKGQGGVAFIYTNRLQTSVQSLETDSHRIAGVVTNLSGGIIMY